jgi:hypothetical protein
MVHPIVAEYLRLTPVQIQEVAGYLAERRARVPWTTIDHVNLTRKAVAILSDEQKELWANLLGQPCQFLSVAQKPASQVARPVRGSDSRQQPGR